MDQLPRLGKRQLLVIMWFLLFFVVFLCLIFFVVVVVLFLFFFFFFGGGFLFLWVLVMGCVISLWHIQSLPYNYNEQTQGTNACKTRFKLQPICIILLHISEI